VPQLVVPVLSRRRDLAQLFQKMQHVVPAAPLLFQGVSRMGHQAHGWSLLLAAGEVGVSVLVLAAFLRQVGAARRTRGADHGHAHASHGIDWVDVLIAAMLAVEVWAHWYQTGHIKRPTVLVAVVTFVVGLLHGRFAAGAARRQGLKIDDAGVAVGGRPFLKFTAAWDELAAVEIEPAKARLIRTDGKVRTFNFRDIRNAAEVREALEGVKLRVPAHEDPNAIAETAAAAAAVPAVSAPADPPPA
jgi:hypothetical protein